MWYLTPEHQLDTPVPEKEDPERPVCGIRDDLTDSTCTYRSHSDNAHQDDSDWRFTFRWRTTPQLSLIVVGEAGEA